MLLATPALEAPVFLSATSPESTMPKQLVLTEGDLASRWAMSPKTLQRWRIQSGTVAWPILELWRTGRLVGLQRCRCPARRVQPDPQRHPSPGAHGHQTWWL
jgi:hypothetical protein